jgi:hypothetical protein
MANHRPSSKVNGGNGQRFASGTPSSSFPGIERSRPTSNQPVPNYPKDDAGTASGNRRFDDHRPEFKQPITGDHGQHYHYPKGEVKIFEGNQRDVQPVVTRMDDDAHDTIGQEIPPNRREEEEKIPMPVNVLPAGFIPPIMIQPSFTPISSIASVEGRRVAAGEELVQLVQSIVREMRVTDAALEGKSEIQLRLSGTVLGGANVKVSREGNSLTVEFSTPNTHTSDLIRHNQEILRNALLQERFQLSSVTINTREDGGTGTDHGEGRSRGQRDAREESRPEDDDTEA